jgi:2'-5' RNA ligase
MPRLFTAIEIPADVAQMLTFLRGGLPGARWIDPENYHITLRFIGDVDVTVAHDVASMLDRVSRAAFELRLDGVSSFGGRKPRAVVANVAPSQALMDLQAEHDRLMQRVGLAPEGRKYTPHVTLARLRVSSSRQVADYLSERGSFRSAPFRAERFVLYSSRDSVGGGPYVVEAAYPLETAQAKRAI